MSSVRMGVLLKTDFMVMRMSAMGNSESCREFVWFGNFFDGFDIRAAVHKGEGLPGAAGTHGLQ